MRPDRIIIGTEDEQARAQLAEVYAPFCRNHDKLMWMDNRSAELTKYAANAMLATRISFMNELANLAERLGADIEAVRKGIGSDPRIGYHFIYPGCGFGGSCFPKDIRALLHTAERSGMPLRLLQTVSDINDSQRHILLAKLRQHFPEGLAGKAIALWGLAFKPNTDDMREAPSRYLMEALWREGATVRAYDPEAMAECRRLYGHRNDLVLCPTRDDTLLDADALVICTEWKTFRVVDFDWLASQLRARLVVDGRNLYNPAQVAGAGLHYLASACHTSPPPAKRARNEDPADRSRRLHRCALRIAPAARWSPGGRRGQFQRLLRPRPQGGSVEWVREQAGDFPLLRLDLADASATAEVFAEVQPDAVIHLAAQAGVRHSLSHPRAYTRSNIEAFLNILEGCRANPVEHLLYASSSSVYGANQHTPYSVHHPVDHPLSLYAATKKANEAMAHAYSHLFGIPCTGLRFFTVYGPWGRPDMSPVQFARAISTGQPLQLFNHGQHQRDFTYIDDIVEGLVRLLDHPPSPDSAWDRDRPDPASSMAPGACSTSAANRLWSCWSTSQPWKNTLGRRHRYNSGPCNPVTC